MFFIMLLCAVISTICFVVWLMLFLRYRHQFDGMLDDVDGKTFTLKDLYFIGLGCIESYEHIKKTKITANEKAIESMKRLSEVFGRDEAELYYYVSTGATISLILTFVPIGLMITCLMQSYLGLVAGLLLAAVLPYGIQSSINAAVDAKKDDILSEFPKMVSRLTLLINAGMLVRRAWDEVANSDHKEKLYAEMRIASKDMQEGMSIEAAMSAFASRCGIREMRKFSSIFVQAVNRGAADSIESMKLMADEAWEQKKQISKQKGEAASGKLMIPNMIMFGGILLIVVAPMIISMVTSFSL